MGGYGTGRLRRASHTPSWDTRKEQGPRRDPCSHRQMQGDTSTWEHFTALSVSQSCASVLHCPGCSHGGLSSEGEIQLSFVLYSG